MVWPWVILLQSLSIDSVRSLIPYSLLDYSVKAVCQVGHLVVAYGGSYFSGCGLSHPYRFAFSSQPTNPTLDCHSLTQCSLG